MVIDATICNTCARTFEAGAEYQIRDNELNGSIEPMSFVFWILCCVCVREDERGGSVVFKPGSEIVRD